MTKWTIRVETPHVEVAVRLPERAAGPGATVRRILEPTLAEMEVRDRIVQLVECVDAAHDRAGKDGT